MSNDQTKLSFSRRIKTEYGDGWRDIVAAINGDENDFTVNTDQGEYRFIHSDDIDEIMKEELLADEYVLGCFVPAFIESITGLDSEAVELIQKDGGNAVCGLGKMMAKHIDEVQTEYLAADGYGHHFNHYDGNEAELTTLTTTYHVFRVG